jgi:hypothetical protein
MLFMMVHTLVGLNPTSQARIGQVLSRLLHPRASSHRRCLLSPFHERGNLSYLVSAAMSASGRKRKSQRNQSF